MKAKYRLLVDFNKDGHTTEWIKEIVCANNSESEFFRIPDINSILKFRKAKMENCLIKMKVLMNEKEGVLEVYEDGETLTCSIQETEHYTLEMVEDLKGADFKETKSNLKKLYETQIAGEDALLLNPIHNLNSK